MELLATARSPYGRVVRIVAASLGVDLPLRVVGVRDELGELLEYNPTGKIPTLVLDDGSVLSESRLICEYLEQVSGRRVTSTVDEFGERHWEGLVTGFLDGVSVWIRELRRPSDERSPGIIELERSRAERCLDYFERHWPCNEASQSYAGAVLATGLGIIETRIGPGWETDRPRLDAWYQAFASSSIGRATSPPPA